VTINGRQAPDRRWSIDLARQSDVQRIRFPEIPSDVNLGQIVGAEQFRQRSDKLYVRIRRSIVHAVL
jgi:hypothetical protein